MNKSEHITILWLILLLMLGHLMQGIQFQSMVDMDGKIVSVLGKITENMCFISDILHKLAGVR